MYEKIKNIYDVASHLNLLVFIVIAIFISTDNLILNSDPLSLVLFIFSANLSIFLILMLPAVAVYYSLKNRINLSRVYHVIFVGLMIYGFAINLLMSVITIDTRIARFFRMVTSLLIFAGSIYFAYKLNINEFKHKIKYASRIFLVLSLAVFLLSYQLNQRNIFGAIGETHKRKNVIVFVVDGFPTYFLREYNADGHLSVKEFDLDALVFNNINTNYTYTYGYFKAFYTGAKSSENPRENILNTLNRNDINAAWLTFHTNGMPDVHDVKNYDGLRSFLCIPELVRFYNIFNINYNLYTNPRMRDSLTQYYTYTLLHKFIEADSFNDLIAGQVERLYGYGKPFLFIVHSYLDYIDTPSNPVIKLWEKTNGRDSDSITISKIHANDNQYVPEEKQVVDKLRVNTKKKAVSQFTNLKEIINKLHRKKLMDNTVIIFTADHGIMFSKGKMFYGFHHDDEVAKVPFVIFNYGKTGTSNKLGETIDISSTLLDIMGVKNIPNNNSISLLSHNEKNYTTSITELSKKRSELFLNIYLRDCSFTVNLPRFIVGEQYSVKSYTHSNRRCKEEKIKLMINDAIKEYKLKL